MKASDIGFKIARNYFEKNAGFKSAAFNQGIKVAGIMDALQTAAPYAASAAGGAGLLYAIQKAMGKGDAVPESAPDSAPAPEQQESQQDNLMYYPDMQNELEGSPYGAYDFGQDDMYGAYDPYMYGAYEEPSQYGAYDPYEMYGAYSDYM